MAARGSDAKRSSASDGYTLAQVLAFYVFQESNRQEYFVSLAASRANQAFVHEQRVF